MLDFDDIVVGGIRLITVVIITVVIIILPKLPRRLRFDTVNLVKIMREMAFEGVPGGSVVRGVLT